MYARPKQIVFLLSGSQACFKKLKQSASNNWLLILLFWSTLFGAILGAIFRRVGPFREPQFHSREMMYLQFPAEIYMNIMRVIKQALLLLSKVLLIWIYFYFPSDSNSKEPKYYIGIIIFTMSTRNIFFNFFLA